MDIELILKATGSCTDTIATLQNPLVALQDNL